MVGTPPRNPAIRDGNSCPVSISPAGEVRTLVGSTHDGHCGGTTAATELRRIALHVVGSERALHNFPLATTSFDHRSSQSRFTAGAAIGLLALGSGSEGRFSDLSTEMVVGRHCSGTGPRAADAQIGRTPEISCETDLSDS